jgi:hypothetical protein
MRKSLKNRRMCGVMNKQTADFKVLASQWSTDNGESYNPPCNQNREINRNTNPNTIANIKRHTFSGFSKICACSTCSDVKFSVILWILEKWLKNITYLTGGCGPIWHYHSLCTPVDLSILVAWRIVAFAVVGGPLACQNFEISSLFVHLALPCFNKILSHCWP